MIAEPFAWYVRIALPFTYSFSKNALWSSARGGGHVFLREKANDARMTIMLMLRAELRRLAIEPVEAYVFVEIFVQKPDHKGDAINVIDSVCDGVKVAIGVDDRWFSLRGLDWSIVKHEPQIVIGVGQTATEHHRPCAVCGRIQPFGAFHRSKGVRHGIGRECRTCVAGLAWGAAHLPRRT